jgi:hypothetical protein
LPTAPFIFASSLTEAMRSRAWSRRATTLATSLPTVVGACRLAVRARQHRRERQAARHVGERAADLVQQRQQHVGAGRLQHQAVAGVVDVLAGAGEVHELADRLQLGVVVEAAAQPVLDRLHVVVGGALDFLDGLRVGFGEARHEASQQATRRFGQGLELGEARIRQRDEPFDLDLHAAVHEAELAQQGAQGRHPGGVAAVERRQGGERGQRHGGVATAGGPF